MIPVTKKAEPADFDTKVRQPGISMLASHKVYNSNFWRKHNYWKNISKELYIAYDGICAYTGEWFSKTTSSVSVDHFIPKSISPALAYEWDNYRLTTPKLNQYKADNVGLADPFIIKPGWFVLDLPSCLIKVGTGLSPSEKYMVELTINILKLNDDDDIVQNRCNVILDFIRGDISKEFMWRRYPYIALELYRQEMFDTVKDIFKMI